MIGLKVSIENFEPFKIIGIGNVEDEVQPKVYFPISHLTHNELNQNHPQVIYEAAREAKISPEDKIELQQLREERAQSFEKILDGMVNEDFSSRRFKNPELIRNIELTKEMVVDNSNLISNLWSADFEFFLSNEKTRAQELADKYAKEIDAMEAELLWTVKETVKKIAPIVSEEYPIPPVAMLLSGITEFPDEAKTSKTLYYKK